MSRGYSRSVSNPSLGGIIMEKGSLSERLHFKIKRDYLQLSLELRNPVKRFPQGKIQIHIQAEQFVIKFSILAVWVVSLGDGDEMC